MSERNTTISRLKALPRNTLNHLLRTIHAKLDRLEARLDRQDWYKDDLYRKSDGLSTHLEGLGRDHLALAAGVEVRVAQLESLSRSVAGINGRLDAIDEKLSALQAFHWDHVALTRRLAAIEDVLASAGPEARSTIEEGANRPLLPFPGLADSA
jgi:hypothetical protein